MCTPISACALSSLSSPMRPSRGFLLALFVTLLLLLFGAHRGRACPFTVRYLFYSDMRALCVWSASHPCVLACLHPIECTLMNILDFYHCNSRVGDHLSWLAGWLAGWIDEEIDEGFRGARMLPSDGEQCLRRLCRQSPTRRNGSMVVDDLTMARPYELDGL